MLLRVIAIVGVAAVLASCGTVSGATSVPDTDPLHPSWAPDGHRIVFAEHYQLFIIDARGGEARQITHDPSLKRDPVWSPSGAEIAYVVSTRDTTTSHAGGTYECGVIYVVRPDGTRRQRLSPRGASDCGPVWSPDGSELAFDRSVSVGDDLYVMTRTGSAPRRIAYRANGFDSFAWAPDSTRLAFSDFHPGDIHVFDLRTGRLNDVTLNFKRAHRSQAFTVVGSVAWSPDGRQLAFEVGAGDPSDPGLYIVSADGSRWHRLDPRFVANGLEPPRWLRDGKMLAESDRASAKCCVVNSGVSLLDLRRHTLMRMNCCGENWTVSPDETKITYERGHYKRGRALFVVEINGRGQRRLIQTPRFIDAG